jgi:glutamyl-tRNA synthetase
MAALHIAAAALSLVPQSHWTINTHKFNIASYDGASAIIPEEPDADVYGSSEEAVKTRVTADKTFKKELYHYLRWALSASAPGPGIPETMVILGRAESLRRLQEAREMTKDSSAGPTRVMKNAQTSENQDKTWMGSLAPGS